MVNFNIPGDCHLMPTITCMWLVIITAGYRSLMLMVQIGHIGFGNGQLNCPLGIVVHGDKLFISEHMQHTVFLLNS